MLDWIRDVRFTNFMGVLLYWVPVALCLVHASRQVAADVRHDISKRGTNYYTPTVTVGTLLGWVFLCLTPAVNIVVAVFKACPDLLGSFFAWLGRVFDHPIISPRPVKDVDK